MRVVLLMAAGCGATAGTSGTSGADRARPERDAEPPDAPANEVVLTSTRGESVRVRVELARTPAEKERGLMHRHHLAADAGMLFVYDTMAHRSFWMEQTFIPLDMIFIDDELVVVGVVERAAPLTQEGREVDAPSRYVLEVAGGFCERHGIGPGATVRLVLADDGDGS